MSSETISQKKKKRKKKVNKKLIKSLKFRLGFATGSSLILAVALITMGFMYIQEYRNDYKSPLEKINNKDWIKGDKFAPISIVEYSDPECPFCKDIHEGLKEIVEENDDVNWIYRHYPLETVHDKSFKESIAIECAGDLEGNDKFWSYLDKLFEITPSNNELEEKQLYEIAKELDIDEDNFKKCVENEDNKDKINDQIRQATLHGAINAIPNVRQIGTPHIYVLYDNQEIPVLAAKESIATVVKMLQDLEKKK